MEGTYALARHECDKYCNYNGNGQVTDNVIASCPFVSMVESAHIDICFFRALNYEKKLCNRKKSCIFVAIITII